MTVPGYEIDRDHRGLTARERQVLIGLVNGRRMSAIAENLGISKQRVEQLVRKLESKGIVTREGGAMTISLPSSRNPQPGNS